MPIFLFLICRLLFTRMIHNLLCLNQQIDMYPLYIIMISIILLTFHIIVQVHMLSMSKKPILPESPIKSVIMQPLRFKKDPNQMDHLDLLPNLLIHIPLCEIIDVFYYLSPAELVHMMYLSFLSRRQLLVNTMHT